MCGIAGVVSRSPVPSSTVDAMLRRQAHRGPDGTGRIGFSGPTADPSREPVDAPVQLGHLRLAILDLSPAGAQPMASEDRRWWIVYNGEICNYLELREELRGLGHLFHTGTDTEVVLAAWTQWGEACLPRFQGMFAFALLDRRERRLHLARDFAGFEK